MTSISKPFIDLLAVYILLKEGKFKEPLSDRTHHGTKSVEHRRP
jgi:hypothetical protein